ncbi:hypothetical protein V2P20_05400 [Methylobacter sp. Wu1]|jgi:hypothetical protein|uniref:hypothetical protein n=1 Tax=Methylobacter sp. Wu1 TaxID=3119359 RepID=UPI002F94B574
MLATHLEAEERYDSIRKITIGAAQRKLSQRPEYADLVLDTFSGKALMESQSWRRSAKRRVDWDWIDGYSSFKFRYPKRFELAVWHKKSLISLTLGRPTYNGTALRLDFIEANPDNPGDIRVFPVVLFAMMVYAEALGAVELRVMKPINEEVKKYYESVGLIYVEKGDYLYMRL